MSQNLDTAFHALKFGIPLLKEGGSVVLMSSCAASIGLSNHESIAAAKAGVEGLTRAAAATYSTKNIRINCVAPGLVKTGLSEKLTSSETALKASLSLHPIKRIGEPQDISSAIAFLINPENNWITGQTLHVDGGLSSIKLLQ